jgi:hypothetical protein
LLKRKNIKYSEETRAKHRAVGLNRKHSQATLAKMRTRKHSEATREKIRIAALDRKHSEATLDKLRGRKFSDEHRAKLGTSVEVKNIRTGEIVKY